MSIKNYNTYFKEEDGKIYYYDENGEKKYVPSQAFADLQEQIDNIGKPLTYSGSKSVTEINTLEEIKIGTVYTITGEAGNITAGNVDVIQGDEIAWGGEPAQWFNIGKDKIESWKLWSEEHGSSGVDGSVYIGKDNSANAIGINIGAENQILNGDDTLGASINIGKYNKNKYGILIGQRNESQGYGYALGDDNTNVYYGDLVLGYENKPNSTDTSRIIIGVKNSGNIGYATTVIGREISANYLNSNSTLIGSDFAAWAQGGSIVIAQNGYNSDKDINGNRVSITADNDASVFGGYSTGTNQTAYKNPGIEAKYNSVIVGQGQNISAEADSQIFGNQSIAKYGSKVLGSHGYAEGDSMVINWPTIKYDTYVSSNKSNYVNDRLATGYFYKVSNGTHTIINNVSGDIYDDRHPNYRIYQSGSKHALMVLNARSVGSRGVYGKWDSDGKTFTEGAGSEWAFKITGTINSDAIVVEYDNGVVTVSSKAEAGSNFPIYYNGSNWVNAPYDKHKMVTDGRYIYYSNSGHGVDLQNEPAIPSFFIDPDFAGLPDNEVILYDARTNQLGYTTASTGNDYKFVQEVVDVYPSAVLSQKEMVTISQAYYGSLALGPRNSAYGGAIAINVTDQWSNAKTAENDYGYIPNLTHNFEVNNGNLTRNKDYVNSAAYGSIAIGLGSDTYSRPIPNTGNYAYGGSLAIGTNNSAMYGSIVLGGNASAYGASVSLGMKGGRNTVNYRSIVIGEENIASAHSYIVGFKSRAESLAYTFGYQNTAYSNGFTFGYNSYASGNGVAVGQQVTAYGQSFGAGWNITADNKSVSLGHNQYATSNSIALGMKGGVNKAEQLSLAIGFQNTASKNSYAIGFNNSAKEFAWTYGFNNYMWGFGMLLGFGNQDWFGSGGYSESGDYENVDMFGRWNQVVGYIPSSKGKSYETTIIGNNNRLIITGTDWSHTAINYGYEFAGIFLGKENECYMAYPGGYNIYLGSANKGAYEAINIGTRNESNGHSISLGWNNKGYKGGMSSHSILIGNQNNSRNEVGYVYHSFTIPFIAQNNLSQQEREEKRARIKEIDEVDIPTTIEEMQGYTASLYNVLTSNGINSVSAEAYINGEIYDSGYSKPVYLYPNSPWAVANYSRGYSYRENGTWYTGYGESAFLKRWIYNNSSYSSYSTGDWSYQYYWEPVLQASAIWKQVSAVYRNVYGANKQPTEYAEILDTSSKYDTFVQEKNQLQYSIEIHTVSSSGTVTYPSIETNSLIIGNENTADHHNSYLFGTKNHSLFPSAISDYNDDGFVYAFGVGNTVYRNYDMAIGYGAIASGGENIAIGAPQETNKLSDGYYLNTNAIGYKNIAIRSTLTGVENIAVNSIVSKPNNIENSANTENLFLNAYISSYNDMHNSIFSNIAPGFSSYYGEGGDPIKLGRVSFSFIHNTLISNSNSNEINASLIFSDRMNDDDGISINDSTIHRSLVGFGQNPITNSKIDASLFGFNSTASNAYNVGASIIAHSNVSNLISDSIIMGSNASNVVGSIVATDYGSSQGNTVQNVSRSLIIGDNTVIGAGMDSPIDHSFIIGTQNVIYPYSFNVCVFGKYNILNDYYKNYINVFGEQNTAYGGNYDRIFGANNTYGGSYNEVYGTENKLGGGLLYHNFVRGSNNYLSGASKVVHSNIFGTSNTLIGDNSFIFIEGANNHIYAPGSNAFDNLLGCNNYLLAGGACHTTLIGQNNSALSGTISYAFGTDNFVKSACSIAIGEGLIADWNQTIVGKFNEALPNDSYYRFRYKLNPTTSAVEEVPITGVVFAVGNGYLDNCYEELSYWGDWSMKDLNGNEIQGGILNPDYLVRSNAMIVSADGTVSARRFVSEESTPIWTSGNISTLATSYDVANNMVIRIENNTINDFIIFNITGLSADEVPNVSVEFINNQADCYPVFKNGNFELYCTDDTCYSGKSYMFRALGSMSEIIEMRTPRTNVTVNGTDVSVNGNLITP